MEDWSVVDGAAECSSFGGNRNVHSLTHSIGSEPGSFEMSVRLTRIGEGDRDGGAGFRIGVQSEFDEYRSNCFVLEGLEAGVIGRQLILGDVRVDLEDGAALKDALLTLTGKPVDESVELKLNALAPDGSSLLGTAVESLSYSEAVGNVALVNNFAIKSEPTLGKAPKPSDSRYRFADWTFKGDAFEVHSERTFGPILLSMYTLSDSRSDEGFVMKLSAFTGPMGKDDCQVVELQVEKGGTWKTLGEATLDPDAWVAVFRIPNWDEKKDTPFKLVYREKLRDGTERPDSWDGRIRANPVGRPMRMAGLTCQNDYGFPYEPVAKNVEKLDPDLVFFSGDQIYESHGGFGLIREPSDRSLTI